MASCEPHLLHFEKEDDIQENYVRNSSGHCKDSRDQLESLRREIDDMQKFRDDMHKSRKEAGREMTENDWAILWEKLASLLKRLGRIFAKHKGNARLLAPFKSVNVSPGISKNSDVYTLLERENLGLPALTRVVEALLRNDTCQDPLSKEMLESLRVLREVASTYFDRRAVTKLADAIDYIETEDFSKNAKLAILMVVIMCGELIPLLWHCPLSDHDVTTFQDLRNIFAHLHPRAIQEILASGSDDVFRKVRIDLRALRDIVLKVRRRNAETVGDDDSAILEISDDVQEKVNLSPWDSLKKLMKEAKASGKRSQSKKPMISEKIKVIVQIVFPKPSDVAVVNKYLEEYAFVSKKLSLYKNKPCEELPSAIREKTRENFTRQSKKKGSRNATSDAELPHLDVQALIGPTNQLDSDHDVRSYTLKYLRSTSEEHREKSQQQEHITTISDQRQRCLTVLEKQVRAGNDDKVTTILEDCMAAYPLGAYEDVTCENLPTLSETLSKRLNFIESRCLELTQSDDGMLALVDALDDIHRAVNKADLNRTRNSEASLLSPWNVSASDEGSTAHVAQHRIQNHTLALAASFLLGAIGGNVKHGSGTAVTPDLCHLGELIRNYQFHVEWVYNEPLSPGQGMAKDQGRSFDHYRELDTHIKMILSMFGKSDR